MLRRPGSRPGEAGYTLIELLVAVTVLGVIMAALGGVVIGYVRNTNATTGRLSESHDAQISAAYFAMDVEGVGTRDWTSFPYPLKQSVELNVAATAGLYPCGTAATPVAVVRLAMDDPTSAGSSPQVARVAYVVQTVNGQRQLHRIRCVGPSATPTSDLVLAHDLDTVAPAFTCSTSCIAAPDVPLSMTLTLTLRDKAGHNPTDPSYVITLTGQRRQT